MVEHAIVKNFFGMNDGMYGFAYVCDPQGVKSGEELFFHLNYGVYPMVGPNLEVVFSDFIERGYQRLRLPMEGDRIVFERGQDRQGRWAADPWAYLSAWKETEQQLYTDTFKWRLMVQYWESYTSREDGPGSPLKTDVRPTRKLIRRQGGDTMSAIKSWDAHRFNLYTSEEDKCDESPTYQLEVQLEDGTWTLVRDIQPLRRQAA